MTEYYYVERVYFDRELAEVDTGRPGLRYTRRWRRELHRYRDCLAFLREIGVRPKDLDWHEAGDFDVAGVEYAEIGGEDGGRGQMRMRRMRRMRRTAWFG